MLPGKADKGAAVDLVRGGSVPEPGAQIWRICVW
jgi:hypothetical protein